jgi:hypothetical protein
MSGSLYPVRPSLTFDIRLAVSAIVQPADFCSLGRAELASSVVVVGSSAALATGSGEFIERI